MKGEGNSYNMDFRMYDPRVGRWLSIDPIVHPWESPYVGFNNNPIAIADPSGLEGENATEKTGQGQVSYTLPNGKIVTGQDIGTVELNDHGYLVKWTVNGTTYAYHEDKGILVNETLWARFDSDYERTQAEEAANYAAIAQDLGALNASTSDNSSPVQRGKTPEQYALMLRATQEATERRIQQEKANANDLATKVTLYGEGKGTYLHYAERTERWSQSAEAALYIGEPLKFIVFSAAPIGEGLVLVSEGVGIAKTGEVFYRAMSQDAAQVFIKTGRMPAGTETFISPTRAFAETYNGVLFKITVNKGTTDQLLTIGVRNPTTFPHPYGFLPLVQKGWKTKNAFFKFETNQVNIGLGSGRGRAMGVFNNNIIDFK